MTMALACQRLERDTLARLSGRRPALLIAVLGLVQLPQQTPELRVLHGWLDTWAGVRWIAKEMHVQRHRLTLRRGSSGWVATFHFIGKSNLPPAAPSGLAVMPTPWEATRWAAWQVLQRVG
jgi:hypothetical protein